MVRLLLVLLAFTLAASAVAQPADALRAQGQAVVGLLRGDGQPEALFTPAFLAEVPATRIRSIADGLRAQYGAPRALEAVVPRSTTTGTIRVDYERAVVAIDIHIEPNAPHRITGLLITNVEMRNDSLERVLADLRALPGQTGLSIARLTDAGAPRVIAAQNQDRPLAVGSAFKLVVLAELSRQVSAGRRRWSDVVRLDRRSLGGTLSGWPDGAPLTLHTLASLMISISDNTATDILLHELGRENVERMMATVGLMDGAARNRPFLSTMEAAALKTGGEAGLAAWRAAGESQRRRMLAALDTSRVNAAALTGNPLALDIEWFASPHDLTRVMDWLRREGNDTARAILAINPAMSAAQRQGLTYVGYKGGSEPGVLNLTWLIRSSDGAWYAIAGTWNNPAAPLDESRFHGLMARAIRLATSSSGP